MILEASKFISEAAMSNLSVFVRSVGLLVENHKSRRNPKG